MTRPFSLVAASIVLLPLGGCAQPLHLQYDFGRAYTQSMQIQANLDRPTAVGANYPLTGAEALLIHANVEVEDSAQKMVTPIEPAMVKYDTNSNK